MSKLNILVVEDSQIHIAAAKEQLGEHNVVVVTNMVEAMRYLGNQLIARLPNIQEKYQYQLDRPPMPYNPRGGNLDVVLTDMHMPGGRLGDFYQFEAGTDPVGIMIALRAAQAGVKYVGMITDSNHHEDAMAAGLDMIGASSYTTQHHSPSTNLA